MRIVDLRSDTKTMPSAQMRMAIAEAELGDADEGEDPTVNKLEAMAAQRLGKEAAILVSSGTQGNMAAVLSQCARGKSVIVGKNTHINLGEAGGLASLAGVTLHALQNTSSGSLDADEVRSSINLSSKDWPKTGMLTLENTQNLEGGLALNRDQLKVIADIAHNHELPFHIDGARLFNAVVYLGASVDQLVHDADTVTFCLSKGLAAPVGSVLCGTEETIGEARRWVKYLGGSMRQAGIIAAAGIVALESMVERLVDDHENARRLATGLQSIIGFKVDAEAIQTNIIFAHIEGSGLSQLASAINERGVRFYDLGELGWRFVTSYGITSDDINYALDLVETTVREFRAGRITVSAVDTPGRL